MTNSSNSGYLRALTNIDFSDVVEAIEKENPPWLQRITEWRKRHAMRNIRLHGERDLNNGDQQ